MVAFRCLVEVLLQRAQPGGIERLGGVEPGTLGPPRRPRPLEFPPGEHLGQRYAESEIGSHPVGVLLCPA